MAQEKQHAAANHTHEGFPWKHVIGYLLSIGLTLLALWGALYTDWSLRLILIVIFGLALIQAALQLLLFMHMTETSSGKFQVTTMLHALFIFIVIIAGSIWVMSFGGH
jgi:cytochrome aa3-600 menaquinol oxidase subunit 4